MALQSSANPPDEIAINKIIQDFIDGQAGTQRFCIDCEKYETCEHNKQKILDCSNLAITMAFDIMNGGRLFGEYDINNQPLVWQNLVSIAISKINQLKNESIKKASNKK